MSEKSRSIPEIHALLGKKIPYEEGLRRVHELEARYNVKIKYKEQMPITAGPDDKELIFTDYECR